MRAILFVLLLAAPQGERDGLSNTFQRLARGEYTPIAYLGGSITAGAGASKPEFCYRSLLTKYLRELYPKASINEVDAAIGGTGSWLGAFRVGQDVLAHGPALVIVEFAVNDGGAPEAQVYASMEGIVRQIRGRNPQTDILFVYTLVKNHMDAFGKGELPDRMRWHEKIAEHYGIPSVNMAQFAAAKILKGELTFDEFAKDGVHPTDRGYALYLEALKPFIDRCKAAAAGEPKKHPMPKPFCPAPMERAKLVPYEFAKIDAGWKLGQPSPAGKFTHVLSSETPGATLTLRFKGDTVGYFDALGPDTGDFEFSIDGADWKPRPNFDQFAKGYYRAHNRVISEGLDAGVEHELRLRVAETKHADSKGRFARIGWLLVNGDAVDERVKPGATALERIDAIYGTMEPVKFTPRADRWALIPGTMKRLQEGGVLRVVMLGDSIVNDTSSSKWDLLVQRLYPKCKIEKVTSVRGSTGCWWYKEEHRVKEWVLDHTPDLVMIGGISQRGDVESIREVIRQVRSGCAAELLVMTGAFGEKQDPARNKEWTFDIDPKGDGYRSKLLRMAGEEKVEFLDMTGPWGQYVKDAPHAIGWFMRDPVHANERGFQILGRILERYFAPKG